MQALRARSSSRSLMGCPSGRGDPRDIFWWVVQHGQVLRRGQERAWREANLQLRAVAHARRLWARYREGNRRDVEERTEQLRSFSTLSAYIAGFAGDSALKHKLQRAKATCWRLPLICWLHTAASARHQPSAHPTLCTADALLQQACNVRFT